MLRILQISDIHWKDRLGANDTYKYISDGMIDDLKCYCQQKGVSFDHILICGDIAFSGANVQYKRAKGFITTLCQTVGCKESEVYVIPGNHDKNRDLYVKPIREVIDKVMAEGKKGDDILETWIKTDFSSLGMMYRPFKDYIAFSERYGCGEPLMMVSANENDNSQYNEKEHKMYWCEELGDGLNGYTLKLFGLNSAFNCDKDDWDGADDTTGHKIFLPKLAYRDAARQDGIVNILMAHHPTSYLVNGKEIQKELDKIYQIQFFGHVHKAKSNCENGCVHIFSGAFHPDGPVQTVGPYRPVYNIVELDIVKKDDSTDVLKVNLLVQVWEESSFKQNDEESKLYEVEIKRNRWKGGTEQMQTAILPDGVTKRDIKKRMIEKSSAKSVIKKLIPGFYNEELPSYYNIARFLNAISEQNRWIELWDEIK